MSFLYKLVPWSLAPKPCRRFKIFGLSLEHLLGMEAVINTKIIEKDVE